MARIAIIAEDDDAQKDALEITVPTLQAIESELIDERIVHQVAVCPWDEDLSQLEELVQEACQQDGTSLFIGVGAVGLTIPEALIACSGTAKPVIYVPMSRDAIRHTSPNVLTMLPSVGGLQAAAIAACRILATGNTNLELALLQWESRRRS